MLHACADFVKPCDDGSHALTIDAQGCPELAALFQACSSHVFQGPLPWKSD